MSDGCTVLYVSINYEIMHLLVTNYCTLHITQVNGLQCMLLLNIELFLSTCHRDLICENDYFHPTYSSWMGGLKLWNMVFVVIDATTSMDIVIIITCCDKNCNYFGFIFEISSPHSAKISNKKGYKLMAIRKISQVI